MFELRDRGEVKRHPKIRKIGGNPDLHAPGESFKVSAPSSPLPGPCSAEPCMRYGGRVSDPGPMPHVHGVVASGGPARARTGGLRESRHDGRRRAREAEAAGFSISRGKRRPPSLERRQRISKTGGRLEGRAAARAVITVRVTHMRITVGDSVCSRCSGWQRSPSPKFSSQNPRSSQFPAPSLRAAARGGAAAAAATRGGGRRGVAAHPDRRRRGCTWVREACWPAYPAAHAETAVGATRARVATKSSQLAVDSVQRLARSQVGVHAS